MSVAAVAAKPDTLHGELADFVAQFYDDPLGFVLAAYPWGEPGPLQDFDGPDIWQREFLTWLGEEVRRRSFDGHTTVEPIRAAVSSGHGIGKAQPVDTDIPTPHGMRRLGDLTPGDTVFGADGQPASVVAVHDRGRLPVYRVAFDDGSATLVCGDHLWTVKGRQQRRNGRAWVTLSTADLLAHGVTRSNGRARARQWEIPTQGAAAFAAGDVPVHPYTLGVWLGDGGRLTGRITSADAEVIDRLRAVGETVTAVNGASYAWQIAGLFPKLRTLGIGDRYSYQKSVPVAYMEAPADVRVEVLRGLLDTDGECGDQGAVVFNSTSLPLVDDVVWLARSLGWKARLQPTVKRPTYPGPDGQRLNGRPCWRATLTVPAGERAFWVTRKQARVRTVEARYLSRWIASIEPAGEAECWCITVDRPDGLYLTNDFIVTHNSTLQAWLVDWIMSTRPYCRGTITANTNTQLDTKTWAAILYWRKLSVTAPWFEANTARVYFKGMRESWFCAPQSCKEENSEAFAGQHAANSTSFYDFDEASAIADVIYEVAQGGMTDGEPMWFLFGNPTRNSGAFYRACFGSDKHRWKVWCIDSRDSKLTNKKQIAEWIADYGEDSDFVRVRVRGLAPKASDAQFISAGAVYDAAKRSVYVLPDEPLVAGLDLARGGEDRTVLRFRRGLDARSIPPIRLTGEQSRDSMAVVAMVDRVLSGRVQGLTVAALFVDATGGSIGGPVADRLRQMGHRNVFDVQFGGDSPAPKMANMRAFMWSSMRDWLDKGAIDASPDLETDLTGPGYGHDKKDRLLLESKESMKKRGLSSPDDGDALALTFARVVRPVESEDVSERYEAPRPWA